MTCSATSRTFKQGIKEPERHLDFCTHLGRTEHQQDIRSSACASPTQPLAGPHGPPGGQGPQAPDQDVKGWGGALQRKTRVS